MYLRYAVTMRLLWLQHRKDVWISRWFTGSYSWKKKIDCEYCSVVLWHLWHSIKSCQPLENRVFNRIFKIIIPIPIIMIMFRIIAQYKFFGGNLRLLLFITREIIIIAAYLLFGEIRQKAAAFCKDRGHESAILVAIEVQLVLCTWSILLQYHLQEWILKK